MTGIVKGLFQWLYGLFLDLLAYCANALLGVMSTDLQFFETSVPIVTTLYQVFVAIGWGLLIGNCAFQCMKAMFAGLGFETESPAVLLMRTFLFGTLLVFSRDICEIGLSLGKNVINLLGVPTSVTLSLPDEGVFASNSSWLLVIIIGFILGFQLIKLFFEIAERYVIVAILTLVCPVGLAMGGSKSTKDICTGYEKAFLSIVEYCPKDASGVFDQDNKGFKGVINALKGRVFPDDNQFELSLGLFTVEDPVCRCEVTVLPLDEASDFLYRHCLEHV